MMRSWTDVYLLSLTKDLVSTISTFTFCLRFSVIRMSQLVGIAGSYKGAYFTTAFVLENTCFLDLSHFVINQDTTMSTIL
jgi:hypothetical protein